MDLEQRKKAQKKVKKAKVMTSDRVKKNINRDVSYNALEEVTLIINHGVDKKGDVILRHPNTCDMLVDKGIAKK